MRKGFFHLFIAIALFAFGASFYSCSLFNRQPISEGVIEYDITYPDTLMPLRYDPSLRPTKALVKFKENKTITTIQGMSGSLSFSLVQNVKGNYLLLLIRLFNKKFYFEDSFAQGQLPVIFNQMPDIIFEPTDEMVNYKSFRCNRVLASYTDDPLNKFEVLYTSDIDISAPNINTPYESIPGVLLKFRLKLWGQTMQLHASRVRGTSIPNSTFQVPEGFEGITRDVLDDIITLVQ